MACHQTVLFALLLMSVLEKCKAVLLFTLKMPISLFYLNSKSFSISAFICYACLCICIMKFNSKYCIYLCIFFAIFCS